MKLTSLLLIGFASLAQAHGLRPLDGNDGESAAFQLTQQFDHSSNKNQRLPNSMAPAEGGAATPAPAPKAPIVPNVTPVPIAPVVAPIQQPQQEQPMPDPRAIIKRETLKTMGIAAGVGAAPGIAAGVGAGFLMANAAGVSVAGAAVIGVGVGLGVVALFALGGAILGYLLGAGEVLGGLFP